MTAGAAGFWESLLCCTGGSRKPPPTAAKQHPIANATTPPPLASTRGGGLGDNDSSHHDLATATAMLRPMSELPAHYEIDWSPHGMLGSGHFAKVFFGRQVHGSRRRVAAKRISRNMCRTITLQTEITALARLSDHPSIVKLYDAYYDDSFCVLMLEYLAGGELYKRIVKYGAYTERDAKRHFLQLAQACQYMHEHGVVHRDLKPENLILIEPSRHSRIKISDFGLAKIVDDDAAANTMSTVCGTKAYSAPEVNFGLDAKARQSTRYNAKVDVWSMGVILYVLLAGYHPFDPFGKTNNKNNKSGDDALWLRVSQGRFEFDDPLWAEVSPQAKQLMREMMQVDVHARLTMQQVCAHEWFNDDM